MTKPNNCYAYFALTDEALKIDNVTALLGVEPNKSWAKGDLSRTGMERKFGLWSLNSRRASSDDLEEHVQDVLLQMDANPEAFLNTSIAHNGTMQLVGEFHEIGVGLHFTKQIIEHLAFYKLCVDFDAYYLYSDSRECTE